ncbi:unnamed protein product, partial [Laminaria digitata]
LETFWRCSVTNNMIEKDYGGYSADFWLERLKTKVVKLISLPKPWSCDRSHRLSVALSSCRRLPLLLLLSLLTDATSSLPLSLPGPALVHLYRCIMPLCYQTNICHLEPPPPPHPIFLVFFSVPPNSRMPKH